MRGYDIDEEDLTLVPRINISIVDFTCRSRRWPFGKGHSDHQR